MSAPASTVQSPKEVLSTLPLGARSSKNLRSPLPYSLLRHHRFAVRMQLLKAALADQTGMFSRTFVRDLVRKLRATVRQEFIPGFVAAGPREFSYEIPVMCKVTSDRLAPKEVHVEETTAENGQKATTTTVHYPRGDKIIQEIFSRSAFTGCTIRVRYTILSAGRQGNYIITRPCGDTAVFTLHADEGKLTYPKGLGKEWSKIVEAMKVASRQLWPAQNACLELSFDLKST